MIAINNHCRSCQTDWQVGFVEILPEIKRRLRRSFRHLDPEARDDATEDGVLHVLLSRRWV